MIARNTTFAYKGKSVNVQQVAGELGVRYVLEGSVRKAGNRVRVTAQLIDGKTGGHVWADRYDRDLQDIFAVQDELTREIVDALRVRLTEGEKKQILHRETDNPEAYDFLLRGREFYLRFVRESNELARQMYASAIELDPNLPPPMPSWRACMCKRAIMVGPTRWQTRCSRRSTWPSGRANWTTSWRRPMWYWVSSTCGE